MSNEPNAAVAMAPVLPPEAQLAQLFMGAFISQAIYVGAQLGIADLLENGALPISELAAKTGMHERSLYRVLRTMASVGVFTETEDKIFANTPVSSLLITEGPNSMRHMAMWMGEEEHWRVYGHLLHSVKTGEPAWDKVHGEPVFPYLFQTNPALGAIFNQAMTSFSHQVVPELVETYDFSGAKRIADIAGGHGHLLAGVLQKYPEAHGVLFDLEPVLAGASALLSSAGVTDRVQLKAGDFFESVPVEADLYMLKYIIHDWNDEQCVTILKNIRDVMPEGATVVLLEAVVPEGNAPDFSKIIDMEMLVSPGGIERTANEFDKLFERSGLRMSRIVTLNGPVSIIEAIKA